MLTIKSALVSGVLAGILAVAGYIIGVGDLFVIDLHKLVNAFVLALLVAIVSVLKNLGTGKDGSFMGVIQVK